MSSRIVRNILLIGGVSVNKEKITALDHKITAQHLLNNNYLLIQKGKSNYTLAIFN